MRRARQVAEEQDLILGECFTDELSAWRHRAEKRPGFSRMMEFLQPGDHLVVWRLNRIERGGIRAMLDVIEKLTDRDIALHVLDLGGAPLDVTSALGKFLLHIMAAMGEMVSDMISESTKEGMARAKALGLKCEPWTGYGRLRSASPHSEGKKIMMWSERECEQIREIWHRVTQEGESVQSVARDFERRGEQTAEGYPWANKRKGTRRMSASRIYNVVMWYRELLARGLDLGCDVTDPRMPIFRRGMIVPLSDENGDGRQKHEP